MSEEFVFDGMVPELQAYLNHCGMPHNGDAYNAWREEARRLSTFIPEGLIGRYHAEKKRWFCRDETRESDGVVHESPSGKYRLVVTRHATVEGAWSYSKGRVYCGERLVAEVCRNYHPFPFAFVEKHPSGHDYLVCGEDYQGQTFVELDTGRRVDYLPKSAAHGSGFCWSSIKPSPSGLTLAVNGCFWAAPYEVWFVDFSDPMSGPPIILKRDADAEDFFGWTDDAERDTATYGATREVYTANNKTIDECTSEELDEWERREDAGEQVTGLRREACVTWMRGTDAEIAREYVEHLRSGWVAGGREVPEEFVANARRMLAKLTDAERASIDASCVIP